MAKIINIHLDSHEGQKLLQESQASQPLLIKLFRKQENNTFCGVQSSALLLSAQHFGAKFPDAASQKDCNLEAPPYLEGNMFSYAETKAAMEEAVVDVKGSTMDQVYNVFKQHGRKVKKYHTETISVDEFRSMALEALSHQDSSWGVIVNYAENQLQTDLRVPLHESFNLPEDVIVGHFSPLGAYHAATDRFLLLDVWYEAYEVWVKTEDLYRTMQTVDTDSGKYRGCIILES